MRISLAALMYNKSYAYVTRHDFLRAYGRNKTVLVTKNVKKLLLDPKDEARFPSTFDMPQLLLLSQVHRPIDMKLVNTQMIKTRRRAVNVSLLCDEKLPTDSQSRLLSLSRKSKNVERIGLFRRRIKTKKLLESTKEEREALANVVLSSQPAKAQSHFASQKPEKPENPNEMEFISVTHAVDIDYYPNYSIEEVSVCDLFDLEDVEGEEEEAELLEYDYVDENYIEEEHLVDDD